MFKDKENLKLVMLTVLLLTGCATAPSEITSLSEYKAAIRNHISGRSITLKEDQGSYDCTVQATQDEFGVIKGVRFTDCDKSGKLKRIYEKTIIESSPIPLPEDKSLFDSEFQFRFCRDCELQEQVD